MRLNEGQVHNVLTKIAAKVKVWLNELSSYHKTSIEKTVENNKLLVENQFLKNMTKVLEKAPELLNQSLKKLTQTATSLQRPINFEMSLLGAIERLDLEIQSARTNFEQTLDVDTVEAILKSI